IDRPPFPRDIESEQRVVLIAELDRKKPPPIHRSLTAYGLSGKTVQITLPDKLYDQFDPSPPEKRGWLVEGDQFATVRNTRVFAGSERLELAEAPIREVVAGCTIELDGLYDGLQPGRWVIVAGERSIEVTRQPATGVNAAEVVKTPVNGVKTAELAMIDKVTQGAPRSGDKAHTFITLAASCLAYEYKRDTVTIYGNVVEATHGETRREVLGSGDAAKALQTFTLKQSPLTFVSAATVSGVDSTLEVRVNDVQWHEADS